MSCAAAAISSNVIAPASVPAPGVATVTVALPASVPAPGIAPVPVVLPVPAFVPAPGVATVFADSAAFFAASWLLNSCDATALSSLKFKLTEVPLPFIWTNFSIACCVTLWPALLSTFPSCFIKDFLAS